MVASDNSASKSPFASKFSTNKPYKSLIVWDRGHESRVRDFHQEAPEWEPYQWWWEVDSQQETEETQACHPPSSHLLQDDEGEVYHGELCPVRQRQPPIISPVTHPFVKFDDFKNYALYINADLKDVKDVLTSCVHLDDLTISRVIEKFNSRDLNKNWPVDFDQASMICVIRMSLSNAAKMWVHDEYVSIDEIRAEKKH